MVNLYRKEVIIPSRVIEYAGSNRNPYFKDIFGENHFFFRRYKTVTKEFYVIEIEEGYCFPNQEIVFAKNQNIIIEQTSYRTHPLAYREGGGVINKIKNLYILLKRIKTSFLLLFPKKIGGNVALLRRDVEDCYGHAISDTVIGFIQVQEFAKRKKIEIDYYIFPTKKNFHKELAQILGIPKEKIISTDNKRSIRAKSLIVPSLTNDYEIVEYRKYIHYRGKYPIDFLANFYNFLIPKSHMPTERFYLQRPKKSNRNVINSSEVEKIFKEYGYKIILPDIYSLEDQIKIFQQAKCIASIHGSGLDNVLFAHNGIFVFEIFSQYYHDNSPMNKCLAKNIHYYYMIGETNDISMHPQQENVYVRPDKLRQALEILEGDINMR